MAKILVVDDSSTVRDEVAGFLKKAGLDVATAVDGRDGLAKLKMDPDYMLNLRHSQQRDKNEALFSGSSVKIDGIFLHEFRHVYNTAGAASGSKWGSGGTVDGCQILFCGAQALGMADKPAALTATALVGGAGDFAEIGDAKEFAEGAA